MPEQTELEQYEESIRAHNLTTETAINKRAVKNDLFFNKEQALEEWCKVKKIFSKAEVMRYGCDNFYLRADRSMRDLVRQGKVMRIFSTTKMAMYRWVDLKGR